MDLLLKKCAFKRLKMIHHHIDLSQTIRSTPQLKAGLSSSSWPIYAVKLDRTTTIGALERNAYDELRMQS